MATYNGEQFLRQQIDSILNQGYKDFEFIICDDKSNDSSIDIVSSYMAKHPQIKLYKNSIRLGSLKNFEKAITLSCGEYIALCDQDDIWREDKLKIQLSLLQSINNSNRTPIMVHSDLRMINDKNSIIKKSYFKFRKYKLKESKDLSHILGPCGVMGNTIVMNKALKKLVLPFPDTLTTHHDYWIAIINEIYGQRVTCLEPLVDYRIHEKNLSNSLSNINRSLLKIRKVPYFNLGREKLIYTILKRDNISKADRDILKKYLKYFDKNSSRIVKYYILIKYDFVKRDWYYRLNLFISLLFTKKV